MSLQVQSWHLQHYFQIIFFRIGSIFIDYKFYIYVTIRHSKNSIEYMVASFVTFRKTFISPCSSVPPYLSMYFTSNFLFFTGVISHLKLVFCSFIKAELITSRNNDRISLCCTLRYSLKTDREVPWFFCWIKCKLDGVVKMYSNCPTILKRTISYRDSSDFLVIVPVLKVNPSIKWPDEFLFVPVQFSRIREAQKQIYHFYQIPYSSSPVHWLSPFPNCVCIVSILWVNYRYYYIKLISIMVW